MMDILLPILILGGIGLLFGIGLAIASKIFEIEQDERIPQVRAALPGANCGGCGYPGCDGLASAIVAGSALVTACPVASSDMVEAISGIMGVTASETEKMIANIHCKGDCTIVEDRATYYGIHDCKEAVIANGGTKACRYGCLGMGTCVRACQFDALTINVNGLAEVDVDKCTACGQCIDACPKGIISLAPYGQVIHVDCSSNAKGKQVRSVCSVGCIACRACVRACEYDAIEMVDNLAVIDYDKCVQCGACAEKCPTKAITFEGREIPEEHKRKTDLEKPIAVDLSELEEKAPVSK